MQNLEHLRAYATPIEAKILDELEKGISLRAAAENLGYRSHTSVVTAISRLRARAALRHVSPEHDFTHPLPEGFRIKRRSDMRENSLGKPVWIISEPTREHLAKCLEDFLQGLIEHVPAAPPTLAPEATDDDLLAVYPMGDPHFGMRAWARETGENFDLKIADQLTRTAIDRLVASMPPARHALFINLGDFFHADDNTAETPAHGNKLDVDGRYEHVMWTGAMAMVHCIERLLQRHERVTVWCLPGNHDPHAGPAMAMMLKMYFREEPRVEIEVDRGTMRFMRFGTTLLGGVHGDGLKPDDLPLIMADERKEDWGQTTERVWHCGHIHQDKKLPFRGCDVETHVTLAASDAWHASKGYKSKRGIKGIVYNRHYGEQQRVFMGLNRIRHMEVVGEAGFAPTARGL